MCVCVCVSVCVFVCNIYVLKKIMCPPGYHHNGFVEPTAFGQVIYSYTLLVPMNQRVLNKLSNESTISVYQ